MGLTKEQQDFIMDNKENMTISQLANAVGISYNKTRAFLMSKMTPFEYKMLANSHKKTSNPLREEEKQFIADNMDVMSRADICNALGRSTTTVCRYIRELNGYEPKCFDKKSEPKVKRGLNQYYLSKAIAMGL